MGGTVSPRAFPSPGAVPMAQPGSTAVGIQATEPRPGSALKAFNPATLQEPVAPPAPIPTKPKSPIRPAQPMSGQDIWNRVFMGRNMYSGL